MLQGFCWKLDALLCMLGRTTEAQQVNAYNCSLCLQLISKPHDEGNQASPIQEASMLCAQLIKSHKAFFHLIHRLTVQVYAALKTGIVLSCLAFCCSQSKDTQVVIICSHIQVLSI